MKQRDNDYDVVIIGTGLSGTMLGSILARQGFRILLLDGTQHPRFAVGESTIGQTLTLLRLIAERYGVPEIAHLASFQDVTRYVGCSHGQKSNFGFMIHRDAQEPNPAETNLVPIPKFVGSAAHFFRQDTDAYLFHTAMRYGCDARQNFRVERIDLATDKVAVIGADGNIYRARYLVDASGFRSPLAHQLGLREQPTRLKHHARSIFTHMIGVEPIDDHMHFAEEDHPPVPYHEGTMHHIFERGWLWVIPFNNYEGATNPLCSIGIQLDPRRYPLCLDLSPEQEFWSHVRRFPAVARQLAKARSVREWVRTDRMQYSSSQTVGHRWCLMSHAAGFLDPLFSRGLSNTCEIINTLAWRLMEALRDDDFSLDRFTYVEVLEQGLLDYNDKLVNSAFISFSNYDMWNALLRIWAAASVIGGKRLLNALTSTKAAGHDKECRKLDDNAYPGLWCPTPFYAELFEEMVGCCEAVDKGQMEPQDAGKILISRVQESDWMLPALDFNRPDVRFIGGTAEKLMELAAWARNHPREEIRQLLSIANTDAKAAAEVGARH
jgi:tetracycline 7-halogenase / FADH2 O2-dependent halogenase